MPQLPWVSPRPCPSSMIGHPSSCLPRRSSVKPGADAEPRRYNVWCCRMPPPVCRAIDWEDLGRFGRRAKPANSHLAAGKTVIYRYAAIYPIARLPRRSTTTVGEYGEHRRQVFPYFLIFSHILPYSPIKKPPHILLPAYAANMAYAILS